KCPAPTHVSANQSADNIAKRASDGNCRVKNCHDTAACLDRKKVSYNGRSSRPVAAFTNSDENSSGKENRECACETRAAASQAPQNHSRADDEPARDPIGEQTENWCAEHIGYEKRVPQEAGLRHSIRAVRRKKWGAHIRLGRGRS